MDVVVLGMSHRTAPLALREKFDFSKRPNETVLPKLAAFGSVRSGMVLSTCNRVEIYAAGEREEDLFRDTERFLLQVTEAGESEFRPHLYRRVNREAVRHLFRVASSLDSMVVGEPQILGQVKEAYFGAREFSLTDPFFDKLLQRAFFVAKKVRTETGVAEQAVSVSYAAVELAERIHGDLSKKQVMILGAGEMAELAARHLKRRGVKGALFINRSYDHSVELAKEHAGTPFPWTELARILPRADLLIVSTSAPHFLITRDSMKEAVETRRQAPVFVIDLSVPRNVDPAIHDLENVYLYNVDDLERVVAENRLVREREAEKAEAIVEVEVARFYDAIGKLAAAPVIARLQSKCEVLRRAEVERLMKRLPELDERQRREIDRATDTLVKRMLTDPILFMGGKENRRDVLEKVSTFLSVFGLDDEEKDE